MTREHILLTIISSLVSGLLGVFISCLFFKRLEERKIKIDTARKLFGHKHDTSSHKLLEALNEAVLVFSDSDDVIKAIDELWMILQTPITSRPPTAANDKMVVLMKAMCREIGIKYKDMSDQYFLRCFGGPKNKM